MPSTVVVGGFFGDEGKGKIISYLAQNDNPSIVVRGGAGPNAGHTIEDGNKKYKVRMLPSGFLNKKARLMIGPGVVVNPDVLHKEIEEFGTARRSFVDNNCGIIEKTHTDADGGGRLKEKIGSTGSGTGPANADRAMRTLKMAKEIPSLKPYLIDVAQELHRALDAEENVLVEGTQGTFLSLWHGTYPFVTSKDVTASGICADIGLGPKNVDNVMVGPEKRRRRNGSLQVLCYSRGHRQSPRRATYGRGGKAWLVGSRHSNRQAEACSRI